MSRQRIVLKAGERVLLSNGLGVISLINRDGYSIAQANGQIRDVAWTDLVPFAALHPDGERAVHRQLSPWWEMLDEATRQEARDRLEIVSEITTGFRDGLPELARDGEPFAPYGESFGASLHQRCLRMVDELNRERESDRAFQRRILSGELKDSAVSVSTIKNWVRSFEQRGLLGLVDARRMRRSLGFEVLDPDFRAAILEFVETFDGDRSAVNNREVLRRARVAMKDAGKVGYAEPARAAGEFVSWLFKERGHSTRAQRSNAIRGTSGKSHFPAVRPGQIVAIDATRADVLVWDPSPRTTISLVHPLGTDPPSRQPRHQQAVRGDLAVDRLRRRPPEHQPGLAAPALEPQRPGLLPPLRRPAVSDRPGRTALGRRDRCSARSHRS